jgi:hypothetical protein
MAQPQRLPSKQIVYTPSPTCRDFIVSDRFYNVLCSARGEGKTTAGLMACLYRAQQVNESFWPLKWALVRDTRKNIGLTTAQTIKQWFPEPYSVWKGRDDEPEKCSIFLGPKEILTFYMFGVALPSDLDRFQSFEATGGVWIEEPAPAATNAETLSGGIPGNVFAMAITSIRGAPTPRVQLTMNPPSADHWVAQLWKLPGVEDAIDTEEFMDSVQVKYRQEIRDMSFVGMIPTGENKALDAVRPGYREENRRALMAMGRSDLTARLVEGRVGYASLGEAVTPDFGGHHLMTDLKVLANVPFVFLYDFGLNPSCIATQIDPRGHWLIHQAWSVPNVGMKQLLQSYVRPWLQQQPVEAWWHVGDPAGTQRAQADSEISAVREIVGELGGRYQPGPIGWPARRDACRDALTRTLRGEPWVRINPRGASSLVRALDGGWAYPQDALGNVRREDAPKGLHSHIGDAFSYGAAVLLKRDESVERRSRSTDRHGRLHKSHQRMPRFDGGVSRTGV